MSYSIYSHTLRRWKEGVPHANKYSKKTIHLKKRTNRTLSINPSRAPRVSSVTTHKINIIRAETWMHLENKITWQSNNSPTPLSTLAVSLNFSIISLPSFSNSLERQIFNGSVNTTAIQEKTGVAAKQDSIQQSYGIPTIKLLNPELFKI